MVFTFLKTNEDLYDRAVKVQGEDWKPRGRVVYTIDDFNLIELVNNCTQGLKEENIFPPNSHLPLEIRALIAADVQTSPMVKDFFRK